MSNAVGPADRTRMNRHDQGVAGVLFESGNLPTSLRLTLAHRIGNFVRLVRVREVPADSRALDDKPDYIQGPLVVMCVCIYVLRKANE